MDTEVEARRLFSSATVFNWLGGAFLLFMPERLAQLMHLPPPAWQSIYGQLCCAALLTFGWAYWMAARDPYRYRPFISIGIIGKTITVIAITTNWALGWIEWPLLGFAAIDGIYAYLFWRFLKKNPV